MYNRFLANLSSMSLFFTIYLGVPKKVVLQSKFPVIIYNFKTSSLCTNNHTLEYTYVQLSTHMFQNVQMCAIKYTYVRAGTHIYNRVHICAIMHMCEYSRK